jgi:hypothetical protein
MEMAVRRVEAVEDARTSRVLCRLSAGEGQGSATVRLHPATNARSLVFDDDVQGVETRVQCRGPPGAECLSGGPTPDTVADVKDCRACPCTRDAGKLYGAYAFNMASGVEKRCRARPAGDDIDAQSTRVLLLGLGGGELATHLVQSCGGGEGTTEEGGSNLALEAVELDSRLPALAKRYFGLPASVKVTVGDAGPVVTALRQAVDENPLLADGRRYDMVLVDCFSTGGVTPEHCRSPEFVKTLRSLLRSGGVVMQHLWHEDADHPEVATQFGTTVSTYRGTFGEPQVSVTPLDGPDSLLLASTQSSAKDSQ